MNKTELAQQVASRAASTARRPRRPSTPSSRRSPTSFRAVARSPISGFGKFSVSDRAARQGVNPATGEKIQIAASKAAKFSAASGSEAAR